MRFIRYYSPSAFSVLTKRLKSEERDFEVLIASGQLTQVCRADSKSSTDHMRVESYTFPRELVSLFAPSDTFSSNRKTHMHFSWEV